MILVYDDGYDNGEFFGDKNGFSDGYEQGSVEVFDCFTHCRAYDCNHYKGNLDDCDDCLSDCQYNFYK